MRLRTTVTPASTTTTRPDRRVTSNEHTGRHEGGYRSPLSAVPDAGTGGAADRLGPHVPGGVERRAGAATVRLDPARRDAPSGRAVPPIDRGPHAVGLAGRPA